MSDSTVDASQVEQVRRQINRLAEEIAQLSELELAPAEYYGEFLQRILTALQAPAGAVWVRTPQGNLQLQYQINMRQVGLDRTEQSRAMHDELLRQTAMKGTPGIYPPNSSFGEKGPGNPTDYFILMAPIIYDKQVSGMVEVWQEPSRGPDAQRGFLQFILKMASLAAGYTRNHQLRQMVGQQAVWVQLEAFARQIHGSLNPTEVSYLIVNEARRLVEADRISVALRSTSSRPQVQAISGADVVEKRSNLVQLMRKLFEEVLKWGERLVYSGTRDDSLPPAVNNALDAYLAESNSKLLVILPLKDERESKSTRPPRSALMMECFEPTTTADQMLARLEVVGRHSTAALYNAAEHHRMPMRFIWLPLAKVQEGLGGKTRAIMASVAAGLVVLLIMMIFVPYPLKMTANGSLLPIERAWVYSSVEGHVKEIINPALKSGSRVGKGTELIRMFDNTLMQKITGLVSEINQAQFEKDAAQSQRGAGGDTGNQANQKYKQAEITIESKTKELSRLIERTGAVRLNPGEFIIRSPMDGIILNTDFRENLNNKYVKPNDPLLRIGNADPLQRRIKEWEIELKIPQKHVGQVLEAYSRLKPGEELDVDLLLSSVPTRTYKGKLARNRIASQANPNRDDNNEAEPVVVAWVRISGKGIPEDVQLPSDQLLTGVEVHTRIRCGDHAMGYSLFYGVWEFLYEKWFTWF